MNLYAETALIALAGVGAFTILAKAQDAYRYFLRNRLDEVTSEDRDNFGSVFKYAPSCYGEHLSGNIAAERDCDHCASTLSCIAETGKRHLIAESSFVKPTWPDEEWEAQQRESLRKNLDDLDGATAKPLWAKKPCYATEKDGLLAQTPPNMGGLGNPPYQGPNYVGDEELAEQMKHLSHYFVEGFFDKPERLDLPMNPLRGDLTWTYEFGRIAPDGSVWTAPDERVQNGKVLIHASEMVKAARFGWTYDCDSSKPAYVWAVR